MIGALLVAAIVVVSASALVFQGRDGATGNAGSTTATVPTTTVAPEPATTAPPTRVEVVPPAPAPAPACDGSGSGVIDAMNTDRAAGGVGALCASAQLGDDAQSWADRMAQHQSLTHQDLGALLGRTSFATVAENILAGPAGMTAGQMETSWMGSPDHRRNIMNGAYRAAGVGIAHGDDGRVWVAVEFGG